MNAAALVDQAPDVATRRALLNILEDLQRERNAFKDARQQWMQTVDALASPLVVHDAEGRVLRANRAYALRAAREIPELIGRPYWSCFPRRPGPLSPAPRQVLRLDTGEVFECRIFEVADGARGAALTLRLFDDVTDRERRERQAAAIVEVSASAATAAGDVAALARQVTEAAARATGVARANVWLFEQGGTVLRCIDLYEPATGRHSAGMVLLQSQFENEFAALKRARYVDAHDPLTDPRTAGYVESYLKPLGITSALDAVIAFPGRHLGLLCLEHVGLRHRWQEDEISFACSLADKLALAIGNAGRRAADEKLRRGLIATVEAIAATLESRDPYTAGHQRRVADLAEAIAREMGLPAHVIEGIHFGALIHDLGKIQVPAELLAKPTRLTKIEFELIKTHPQAGYEIVKSIEFPWRVAEMVHQHHERLDGSGYPQGLKGEEIALEARILAVADVVEAMASHRPYRPGLGIDVALKEIADKRGKWFEPAAVDACTRLFREKGFKLGGLA